MIDIFVDWPASSIAGAASHNRLDTWTSPERLRAVSRRATCVAPPGAFSPESLHLPAPWRLVETGSALPVLNDALAAAGRADVPLLLLSGAVDIDLDVVGMLQAYLDRDPMFGFVVPRVGCADRCCFARLLRHGVGATAWLPRAILAELPTDEVIVEIAAACMLVAPQVLSNFGPLDRQFTTVSGAMLHYAASARRCGFRTVLCNRAVVGVVNLTCREPATPLSVLPALDLSRLHQRVPEFEPAWEGFRAGSRERFETLCMARVDHPGAPRPSLLIDVRNLVGVFNGTAQAILRTVQGLRENAPPWEVALLARPEGARFHNLAKVCGEWPIYTELPQRPFTAAVRLSQPWHIQEIVDLHQVALVNVFMMLDTIAWDIAYPSPHLDGSWRFLAEHADALLFDSAFTEQRFEQRFLVGRTLPGAVTRFSFDPNEYIRRDVKMSTVEDYILVIGNSLDHKDVRQTVEALASAFPFRRIEVIGPAPIASSLITAHQSGDWPELELHRLYANAAFVVYPSFYEGFGFPLVTALAYHRTVLARHSTLLEEIADQCAPRGRLVTYTRREELVHLIGQMVHGEPVPEYPLGRGRNGQAPRTWRDVARETVEFLDRLVRQPATDRWLARERAVRQLAAYRN